MSSLATKKGIKIEKQVIPNLMPLLESAKLDRELKSMLRENFREFFSSSDTGYSEPSWDNKLNISYNAATTDDLRFSDEEEDSAIMSMKDEHSDDDDLPLSKVIKMEKPIVQTIPEDIVQSLNSFVTTKTLDNIELLLELLNESSSLSLEQEARQLTEVTGLDSSEAYTFRRQAIDNVAALLAAWSLNEERRQIDEVENYSSSMNPTWQSCFG
ncbi:hypothetical protein pipiens_015223 [Culex pipiens pipiens]|uniref:Uncharacterized protein n=2 Tax=Culex pipiens pipiens TaxID=38569 RepID=A0ABD1CRG8_CULPP